jgi:hypothetical protein
MHRSPAPLQVLLDRHGAERATGFSAVGSFADSDIWLPFVVQVHDGFLEWKRSPRNSGTSVFGLPGQVDEHCLWRFLRLATAEEEAVARFARQYGVLYLASHGIPGGSPPTRVDPEAPVPESRAGVIGPDGKFKPFDLRERWYREPVEAWRAWAAHAKLVLTFGIALRDEKRIDPRSFLSRARIDPGPDESSVLLEEDSVYLERREDGELQLSEYGFTLFWRLSPWRLIRDLEECTSLQQQRECLARYIDEQWLYLAELTVRMEWGSSRPRIRIDRTITERGGLFGFQNCFPVLAGQLVATILSQGQVNFCAVCGVPYPCARRRATGLCSPCRANARRAAQRRWKAKNSAGKVAGEK